MFINTHAHHSHQNIGFPTSMLTWDVFNLLNCGNLLDGKKNGFSILISIPLIICKVKHVYIYSLVICIWLPVEVYSCAGKNPEKKCE